MTTTKKVQRSGPWMAALWLLIMTLPNAVSAETIVYLVRHAEPVSDGSRDPVLNPEGRARARYLAEYFADRGIDHVYSTEFHRTTGTAAPVAERFDLKVEHYDPRALDAFAETLKGIDGVVVVAGHSNTTPALVNLLVGEERFLPLQHFQFDFIFRVQLTQDGGNRVSIDYSLPRSVYGDHPLER